jgi:hypothetical protein
LGDVKNFRLVRARPAQSTVGNVGNLRTSPPNQKLHPNHENKSSNNYNEQQKAKTKQHGFFHNFQY